jgi:hypothetical protein
VGRARDVGGAISGKYFLQLKPIPFKELYASLK